MIEYNPLAKNHNRLKRSIEELKEKQKRKSGELSWYNGTSKEKLQKYILSLEFENTKYQSEVRKSAIKINKFNTDIEEIRKQIESIVELEIKEKQQERVKIKKGIKEIEEKIKASEIHVKEVIKSIIKTKFLQVEKIDNDLDCEYKQVKALKGNIKSRFNPLNWISKEQNNYVKEYKSLNNSTACKIESKLSMQASISYFQRNLENLEMSISSHFDSEQKIVLQCLDELKNSLNINNKLRKNLLKDIHYLDTNSSNPQLNINDCKNKQGLKKYKIDISKLENIIICECRQKEEIEKNVEQNKGKIRKTIFDIGKLEKFDAKKVKGLIANLEGKILRKKQQVQLKEHVDRKLVPIIFEINRLGNEKIEITNNIINTNNYIEGAESSMRLADSSIENANNIIKKIEVVITKAKRFKDRLNNSVDRRSIHEQCELELGDGSPGRVVHEKRGLIREQKELINEQRDLKSEKRRLINEKKELLRKYKRQVTGINRNIEKNQKEAFKVSEKESRTIDTIVIDGNNMCYDNTSINDKFIELRAITKVASKLKDRFNVIIVFDSSIRALLRNDDEKIRSQFVSDVMIHIVATKELADKTIIKLTSNNNQTYIVSNDRYGEFVNEEAVKNGRLIRHEIVSNKIFIHDLDINIQWK
ncbi:Exonuclease SbcC [hydrothermal vent metagenome]|uniref:Exonuclease SbcC n=1 Tax=hydrothermal vent metagenome TaxID=652676 RepID=A0A1W1E603_9ZZZZ